MWDESTYLFPNLNNVTVEILEWVSNSSHTLLSMWLLILVGIKGIPRGYNGPGWQNTKASSRAIIVCGSPTVWPNTKADRRIHSYKGKTFFSFNSLETEKNVFHFSAIKPQPRVGRVNWSTDTSPKKLVGIYFVWNKIRCGVFMTKCGI